MELGEAPAPPGTPRREREVMDTQHHHGGGTGVPDRGGGTAVELAQQQWGTISASSPSLLGSLQLPHPTPLGGDTVGVVHGTAAATWAGMQEGGPDLLLPQISTV